MTLLKKVALRGWLPCLAVLLLLLAPAIGQADFLRLGSGKSSGLNKLLGSNQSLGESLLGKGSSSLSLNFHSSDDSEFPLGNIGGSPITLPTIANLNTFSHSETAGPTSLFSIPSFSQNNSGPAFSQDKSGKNNNSYHDPSPFSSFDKPSEYKDSPHSSYSDKPHDSSDKPHSYPDKPHTDKPHSDKPHSYPDKPHESGGYGPDWDHGDPDWDTCLLGDCLPDWKFPHSSDCPKFDDFLDKFFDKFTDIWDHWDLPCPDPDPWCPPHGCPPCYPPPPCDPVPVPSGIVLAITSLLTLGGWGAARRQKVILGSER